jgi:hypothetical protein
MMEEFIASIREKRNPCSRGTTVTKRCGWRWPGTNRPALATRKHQVSAAILGGPVS